MVWTRSPVYFYQRNDIYYFSRAVPKDLQARFNKRRVEVSLKTKEMLLAIEEDCFKTISIRVISRLYKPYPLAETTFFGYEKSPVNFLFP